METGSSTQVLIVGGGVAGLALAARLGAAGRSVTVLDKAPLPRDKVCGEGVMPAGLAILREWGLAPERLPGSDFAGLDYRTPHREVSLSFPAGVTGRGVRRTALIAALAAWAASFPSVRHVPDTAGEPVWEGGRIAGVRGKHGTHRAEVVVAADGVHSALARRCGVPLRSQGYRMGLRQHYHGAGVPMERVAVGLFSPFDLYLTPVGGGEFLATLMTDREGYRSTIGRYGEFLRESPFGERFAEARPVGRQLAWYHPLFAPRRYQWRGLLLVGDAGGGVDPCLGVGISMALDSVQAAERAVAGILDQPEKRAAWEERFDRERKNRFQHYSRFGTIFRLMIRSSAGGEALLWGMEHWPTVAEALLDIVATRRSWSDFPWPALLEPMGGWMPGRAGR